MQSMVLSRESISSVYAVVIAVRPRFATSSFTQSTGIHSDTVIGTALRRACGASCIRLTYNVQAGRPKNNIFFLPAFFTRLLTPRSRKSGYGLLLGCRSGLDRGPFEKTFFDKVRTQNPRNSSLSVLAHDRNRSGVVELVGREPLIIARVENGVTKFWPQRQKTPKFSKRNLDQENSFQWGMFIFWPREN